jgi:hypothetical protein
LRKVEFFHQKTAEKHGEQSSYPLEKLADYKKREKRKLLSKHILDVSIACRQRQIVIPIPRRHLPCLYLRHFQHR